MEPESKKYRIIKSPVLGEIRLSFPDHADAEETETKPAGVFTKTQSGLLGDLEELGFGQKIFATYIHLDYHQHGPSFHVYYFSTREEAENYVRSLRDKFEEDQESCDEKEDFEDYYLQIHIEEVKIGRSFMAQI